MRGELRRNGHHRACVRQAPRGRASVPARTARVASLAARRKKSPDHGYYHQAADRLGGNRALLGVMRKLLKRSYHTLRELGDEAFAPA